MPTVEELQAELDAANAKLAIAAKRDREQDAKDYIADIGKLGLSSYPGFLAKVEQILLADDGDAALLLSEDGADKVLTATEIVKDLIDSFPKDDKGAIQLAAQHVQVLDDVKPPKDTGDELSQEEKTKAAIDFLGLNDPKRARVRLDV